MGTGNSISVPWQWGRDKRRRLEQVVKGSLTRHNTKCLDNQAEIESVTEDLVESIGVWLSTPMPRPDWITYFASMATLVSTRATCPRKSVGAVLVSADHRIVSTGYNGSPKGMPHCTDEGVGCLLKEIDGKESCIRTLHAESNALDFAGQTAEGCRLYTTVIPCFDCAKRIVHAGVTTVYFAEWYESRNTNLVEAYFESSRTNLVRL